MTEHRESFAPGEGSPDSRRWLILGVVALAQLMVVLDASIVNIALPSAQKALGFSTGDRQWIVTGYSLAFASLLLLGGRLSDIVGRKRMFITGLIGFAGASAVGGASTDFAMLVSARALQGGFGAMLAPAALSTLTTTFTRPDERRKAFGIWGAVSGGGAAVGLLLGGALTEYLSWRWCLYVNVLLAVVSLAGAVTLLQHRPDDAPRPRMDIAGAVLAAGGLFCIVFGFSRAETNGWLDGETLGFLAGGVALVAAFVVHQSQSDHPLLPLRIVIDRTRGGSYLAILLSAMGMFGVFLFLTYYLQSIQGYSALKTGLAFLPMVAALMATAQISSQLLSRRVGSKWLVMAGMLAAGVGMVVLAQISVTSSYLSPVLPGVLCIGVGLGLIFASAMNQGTAGLGGADAGVGSATVSTMQQLGGSIGTSLLNTLAASATATYLTSHGTRAVVSANVHGFVTAFWWSAGIFVVGALVAAVLLPGRVTALPTEESAAIAA